MEIGDRVYHRGINGNGKIVAFDDTKQRDKWGVLSSFGRNTKA
jgi:hypothetical protein